MPVPRRKARHSRRPGLAVAVLITWFLAGPASVQAQFIVAVPSDLQVSPGGSGSFDVTLHDTDPIGSAPASVAGVQLELRVDPASGITFTDATTSTNSPYIFAGNSADDTYMIPLATSSVPSTDLTTLDTVFTANSSTTVNPGDTFGLAHVLFSAAMGATPGTFPVSIVVFDATNEPSGTQLTDPLGNSIPFLPQDGSIQINGVPEPSTIAMTGLAASLLVALRAIRLRRPGKK